MHQLSAWYSIMVHRKMCIRDRNAGYIENWTFHNTYSGTPQGGIISPILANIYLDKFDTVSYTHLDVYKRQE